MKKRFICAVEYPAYSDSFAPTVYFKKNFKLGEIKGNYRLFICALGIGYCYINGKRISEDLFTAPVSDYRKTLWVNRYDITPFLQIGQNEIFVEVGNGFYNEGVENAWGHHLAAWRGAPTLSLSIYREKEELLSTDETWETALSNTTVYNELYSGEHFDSRNIGSPLSWQKAVKSATPPKGRFRICNAQPIREFERFAPVHIRRSEKGWVFDFGRNISGYTELSVSTKAGQEIALTHLEDVDENGNLKNNGLHIYQKAPFQFDKIIGNGEYITWKPKFTYHGFRYVEVEGLIEPPTPQTLTAIFVHQDVEKVGEFVCSDKTLNDVYEAGIASTYSNMFYALTDCPTREKLGWTNDAQASLEQMFFNFDCERFFEKWLVDICDTMNKEGNLAGIAPSPDWGYAMGPVCNGIVFTLPYALYKYTNNQKAMRYALPYMKRYFTYLKNSGGSDFRLNDWARPKPLDEEGYETEKEFIRRVYLYIFSKIFIEFGEAYDEERKSAELALKEYIENGKCSLQTQTAVSVCIILGIGNKATLSKQLLEILNENGNAFNCGSFGTPFFFKALLEIGRSDLAYKMITSDEEPSYKAWLNQGATTMWETFHEDLRTRSKNHHMFSCVLYFFIEGICGLKQKDKNTFLIEPSFVPMLSFAKCSKKIKSGEISLHWWREDEKINLKITVKGNAVAIYGKERIQNAEKIIFVKG